MLEEASCYDGKVYGNLVQMHWVVGVDLKVENEEYAELLEELEKRKHVKEEEAQDQSLLTESKKYREEALATCKEENERLKNNEKSAKVKVR